MEGDSPGQRLQLCGPPGFQPVYLGSGLIPLTRQTMAFQPCFPPHQIRFDLFDQGEVFGQSVHALIAMRPAGIDPAVQRAIRRASIGSVFAFRPRYCAKART